MAYLYAGNTPEGGGQTYGPVPPLPPPKRNEEITVPEGLPCPGCKNTVYSFKLMQVNIDDHGKSNSANLMCLICNWTHSVAWTSEGHRFRVNQKSYNLNHDSWKQFFIHSRREEKQELPRPPVGQKIDVVNGITCHSCKQRRHVWVILAHRDLCTMFLQCMNTECLDSTQAVWRSREGKYELGLTDVYGWLDFYVLDKKGPSTVSETSYYGTVTTASSTYYNTNSSTYTTTEGNDMNLDIATAQTKAGWVGQIHSVFHDSTRSSVIVWESAPVESDQTDDQGRVLKSAETQARELAVAKRAEVIAKLFDDTAPKAAVTRK